MLALNNRTSSKLDMSPFFMEHGYIVEPIQIKEPLENKSEPTKRALNFIKRLAEAQELA